MDTQLVNYLFGPGALALAGRHTSSDVLHGAAADNRRYPTIRKIHAGSRAWHPGQGFSSAVFFAGASCRLPTALC